MPLCSPAAGGGDKAVVEQPPLPLHCPALQRPGGCVPAWDDARNPPFKHPGTDCMLPTVAGTGCQMCFFSYY